MKYQKFIFGPILKTKKPLYSSDRVVFKKIYIYIKNGVVKGTITRRKPQNSEFFPFF